MKMGNKKSLQPIGIFDSGIGGLTVVKEIINILPNEDIVYKILNTKYKIFIKT